MAEGESKGRTTTLTDRSNWMSQLIVNNTYVPLNCLAIPGSHDSFTSWLDTDGPVGLDESYWIQTFGGLTTSIVNRWGRSQSLNISKQLKAGIRYLDLRIGRKPGTEDVYLLHGLYGVKVESFLKDVKAFLNAHPQEVVLLDFSHFTEMTESQHRACISMIMKVLGHLMCSVRDMGEVTLNKLWQSKLQALVFYQPTTADVNSRYGITRKLFWPKKSIPSPWPNVNDTAALLTKLDNYKKRDQRYFYVTQGILTPGTSDVAWSLWGSLEHFSEPCAKPVVNWIKRQKAGPQGINVCIMDFVERCDYIPTVLALNYRL